MEAEQARTRSEAEHKKTAANYNSCINHMKQLEKKLKRSINKSRSAKPVLHLWLGGNVAEKLSPRSGLFMCEGVCVGEKGATLMSSDPDQMFHVMVL